jgi:EpsI family protein
MKINPVQAILASIVVLLAAVMAQVLTPHELMAKSSAGLDLEKIIPQKVGGWTVAPGVGLVAPSDAEGVELDADKGQVYSQEVGRAYVDADGHIIMLMVAYGPVQNYRLKAHRPEICYTAAGFRVSEKFGDAISYGQDRRSVQVTRLVTQRETRYEPLSYWMRVGNDVSTGIIDRQLIRLKYGLQGLIPDGALVRVSTLGVDRDLSFKLQDDFIREFLTAVDPAYRKFFVGT